MGRALDAHLDPYDHSEETGDDGTAYGSVCVEKYSER